MESDYATASSVSSLKELVDCMLQHAPERWRHGRAWPVYTGLEVSATGDLNTTSVQESVSNRR